MMRVIIFSVIFATANTIDFEGRLIAELKHDATFWTGQGCEPVHGNVADENCMYHIDDMMLTKDEVIAAYGSDQGSYMREDAACESDRNGIIGAQFRWPAGSGVKGQMVYTINKDQIPSAEEGFIKRVITRFNKDLEGCLRIVPRTTESSYLHIGKAGGGCSSYVGKIGQHQQPQDVTIDGFVDGSGCYSDGTVIHELIHAWGFHHEHTRKNRDDFVEIIWNNIESDTPTRKVRHNFCIEEESNDYGVPYDGLSIMHYGSKDFSKDDPGTTTIKSKRTDLFTNDQMGENNWMSLGDVSKLRQMYGCDKGSCKGSQTCDNYAREGACDAYPGWAKNNCQSSCNTCNGVCEDIASSQNCVNFVKKHGCFQEDSNTLETHKSVQHYCKKTCNLCPSNCHDNDYKALKYSNRPDPDIRSCAEWKEDKQDLCKDSSYWLNKWVRKNCRKTCGLCLGMKYIEGQQDDRSDMPLEIELPEFSEDQVTVLPEFSEDQVTVLPEFSEDQVTVLPEFSEDQDLMKDLPDLN